MIIIEINIFGNCKLIVAIQKKTNKLKKLNSVNQILPNDRIYLPNASIY